MVKARLTTTHKTVALRKERLAIEGPFASGAATGTPSPNKFLRAVRAIFLHPPQTLERDVP